MTYTTKLSPGDAAWFIRDNRVVCFNVDRVIINHRYSKDSYEPYVGYGFYLVDVDKWLEINEKVVFASKAELLASL